MAVDLAGTITYLKDHAIEHGFHVHDERHFVETYTLRQSWEVDVHPGEACDGPLDLHLAIDVDPRLLLRLEDLLNDSDGIPEDPNGEFVVSFFFNWALPPMTSPPDLLMLSAEPRSEVAHMCRYGRVAIRDGLLVGDGTVGLQYSTLHIERTRSARVRL